MGKKKRSYRTRQFLLVIVIGAGLWQMAGLAIQGYKVVTGEGMVSWPVFATKALPLGLMTERTIERYGTLAEESWGGQLSVQITPAWQAGQAAIVSRFNEEVPTIQFFYSADKQQGENVKRLIGFSINNGLLVPLVEAFRSSGGDLGIEGTGEEKAVATLWLLMKQSSRLDPDSYEALRKREEGVVYSYEELQLLGANGGAHTVLAYLAYNYLVVRSCP